MYLIVRVFFSEFCSIMWEGKCILLNVYCFKLKGLGNIKL